ncbi:MAG: sulfur carrier protein ThiS [Candidatus Tyrphobacter sp.]
MSVNGREREVPDEATIADLLGGLDASQSGIAIACNDRVVRCAAFAEHRLAPGDRVEIIKAVAGG